MTRKARVRAAAAAAIALVIGILLTLGISGAFGTFSAETQNSSSAYAGGWVVGPSAFNTPVASGNGEYFTWTVGNYGVAAQEVYFADQGSTSNCTGASYANSLYSGGTALGPTIATIDGAASGTSSNVPAANQGDYICYEVRSTNNAWWTPTDVGTAVEVGLRPTSISYNGNGHVTTNTTFTIGFNHTPATSVTDLSVTVAAGSVSFPGIGTVTGAFTKSFTCTHTSGGANVTVSGTSIVIKVQGCPSGGNGNAAASGSGTFTASGTVISSAIGPASHVYTVNPCYTSSRCTPGITY